MAKRQGQLKFWLLYGSLITIIIVLALTILKVKKDNPKPAGASNIQKSLTDFYRRYRNDVGPAHLNDNGEFVVDLAPPSQTMSQRIASMPVSAQLDQASTQGMRQNRLFASGEHLSKVIADYAQKERVVVLWDLPQDFVVKSGFQVHNTLTGTLETLRSAIKHNFVEPIHILQCPQRRALVVTLAKPNALRKYCSETK